MWEDLRSKWQRERSEVLRVALLALFAVAVKIATGVAPIAACFLAVMLMLPCAFVVLVIRTTIQPYTRGTKSCHRRTIRWNSLRLSRLFSFSFTKHNTIVSRRVH